MAQKIGDGSGGMELRAGGSVTATMQEGPMSQMDLPRLDRNRGAVQAAGLYWMEEVRMKALGTQMNFCEWEIPPLPRGAQLIISPYFTVKCH